MSTIPASIPIEAAEILHDLEYREHVPSDEEEDRAQEEALANPELLARWWIDCDDTAPIVKMLGYFKKAERISAYNGPTHDKFRQELVYDMIKQLLESTREYAKENC